MWKNTPAAEKRAARSVREEQGGVGKMPAAHKSRPQRGWEDKLRRPREDAGWRSMAKGRGDAGLELRRGTDTVGPGATMMRGRRKK